jgi:hypothetical protein
MNFDVLVGLQSDVHALLVSYQLRVSWSEFVFGMLQHLNQMERSLNMLDLNKSG